MSNLILIDGKQRLRAILVFSIATIALSGSSAYAAETVPTRDEPAADRLFTLHVLPVFKEKCFGCHGADADDLRGGYNMLTRESMLRGGESEEQAVLPGNPDASPLYQAVLWEGYEMPPKENDRLTQAETDAIRQWIASGAPWPDAETRAEIELRERSVRENENGVIVTTSGGLSDDWTYRRYTPEDLWAFQPIRVADVDFDSLSVHPIDYFVNEKLSEVGLRPAEPATPRTMIRRASYDLIGLPPTPEAVAEYELAVRHNDKQAYSDLVDKLLESEHYGERWAQHWLDVVRYADTAGFSNDYERSNAWRYRDYIIRSLNADKPFNEMIVEQIAGDELKPSDPEGLIATGFLRMGPWGTAMIPADEARQQYLDDLVHTVGQSFLSMPMRCCKCHDHKFDPIPTRDYYRMYAAFATTQPAELTADFLPEENCNGFERKRELVKELLDYAQAERDRVINKQEAAAKQWYAENNLPYKNENQRKNDPEASKPPRHVGLTPEETGIKKVREQDVWIWQRRLERYQPMAQAVYNGHDIKHDGRKLRKPKKIKTDWRPDSYIFGGGALEAKLMSVAPGVLSGTTILASASAGEDDPWRITTELTGRRLELALWIASDDNPLTARSIVNRVWQYHFGTGLAKTANNFGAKGSKPTHPELLDWLTADFIAHGWKLKRLHHLIMTSAAYRRSSKTTEPEQLASIDPNNQLLSTFTPRRLTAEELRDSTLLVTGELNPEVGGLPVMPEINMEVALQPRMIQFSIAPAHQPSRTPAERNRRTIYTYRVRGQVDPFLEVMNLPNPNESCELRDSAAVTPQAFTLINSDMMTDRSIAFALRLQNEYPNDELQSLRRAIELAYGREASEPELDSLLAYLLEMQAYHRQHSPEAKQYPTHVKRSLVEELTGKPFEFIEKLNVFENYIADAKPWTVNADTRALADVCLLLLNANEFVYVY